MRNQGHREVKCLAEGHPASKDYKPRQSGCRICAFNHKALNVVLTFTKHFLSATQHAKYFVHFTEEETEAQRGSKNFLRTTGLEVAR